MYLLKLGAHFIIGGIIIASVYHFATVVKNPALAAIFGAFPLTILCCYIIQDRNLLGIYAQSMVIVLMISIVAFIVMIGLIVWTKIQPIYIITLVLGLWTIAQWVRYRLIQR